MAATGPSNSPQSAAAATATELPTKSAGEDSTQTQPEQAQKSDDMTQTNNNSNTNNAAASHAPNYFSTKTSKAYTLAYKLLNSDNFQDALSTLETALQFTVQILGTQEGNDEVELHESLAPLYYLYGSTLLYSVEESDVMMASSAPPAAAPDLQVGDDDDDDANPEMMSKNNPPQPSQAGGEEQPSNSDPTEDLQIAWENLETARSIVTKMVETFHPLGEIMGGKSEYNPTSATTTTSYTTPKEQSDLLLDLAQVHTRLGDLQRGNNSVANTSDCIADYSTALKLRTQVLGRYDKKVADSHYSLAGVCAEAPSQNGGEVEEAVDRFVSQMGGGSGGSGGGKEMTESEKMEYRERSLEHYVQCAVSFSGLLAKMCGEDADAFTSLSGTTAAASASASASSEAESGIHSSMLSTLRSRVSNLTPPTKSPEKESFEDIAEILDEIQEAVDTAEEAEEGLRTLGAMKANEIRKHEAKMNGEQGGSEMEEEGGGMTTIGFGASAASSTAAASATINVFGAASAPSSTSANAFGSASVAASASATAAKPMMVVKKKKKVQPVLIDASSTKRAKTE